MCKSSLPPLLETRASNESLPSSQENAILSKKILANSNKIVGYDIFDAKACLFPNSLSSGDGISPITLGGVGFKIGVFDEAKATTTTTATSPTISSKSNNNYHQSNNMIGVGLGICGIMNLRRSASEKTDEDSVIGETDLSGPIETVTSTSSSSANNHNNKGGLESDRKWCYFVVTFFIALTICVVVVSLALELVLGSDFVDRNSDDYRLQTIKRILKETPLIGKVSIDETIRPRKLCCAQNELPFFRWSQRSSVEYQAVLAQSIRVP